MDATSKLKRAWMPLWAAIALHVADEAVHDLLGVYNPTVRAMRAVVPWLPLPSFTFRVWIAGLIAGIALGFIATPLIPRLRLAAYAVAILMTGNGLMHALGTILGHTVPSVQFPRPMPGFDSSPVLIAASIWMLVQLRRCSFTR